MKLYEAIRLGAMLGKQCHGKVWWRNNTCAMGAAITAVGGRNTARSIGNKEALLQLFPFSRTLAYNPRESWVKQRFMGKMIVADLIVILNDNHFWSRHQIADWLEPIEKTWYAKRQPNLAAIEEAWLAKQQTPGSVEAV